MVNKKTFDTLNALRVTSVNKNMYEEIYSKHKRLKDDKRLFYYSFAQVVTYPEVINLIIFSILYCAATAINIDLAHPSIVEDFFTWPFERYAEGVFVGFLCIIIFSDYIF